MTSSRPLRWRRSTGLLQPRRCSLPCDTQRLHMTWSIYFCIFLFPHFQSSNTVQGAIKKFSAWPSSVQNKMKTVLVSYCSKAQNTTSTIWLLGYKYFVHLSGRWLFADKMKNVMQCNEMTIVTNLFVPLHAFCSDSESKLWIHVSSWITSCEINFQYHTRNSS